MTDTKQGLKPMKLYCPTCDKVFATAAMLVKVEQHMEGPPCMICGTQTEPNIPGESKGTFYTTRKNKRIARKHGHKQ